MNITVIATGPSCIYQPRPHREPGTKRVLPKVEENWLNLKPFFKTPVQPSFVAPHGSTKPLEGLGQFLSRIEEIKAIAKTQHQELPSLAAEFRANGLQAISLSSSSQDANDDDTTAANIAEHHLHKVPYSPDPVTLAALVRRIDWEKYRLACGQATRVYAKVREDNSLGIACNNRTWTNAQLAAFAPKIKTALADRDGKAITNDRERAQHYKNLVWAAMTPDQQHEWHMRTFAVRDYLDCADDNLTRETFADGPSESEPQPTSGPQELGLHTLDIDLDEDGYYQYEVRHEPTEFEFWPLSEQERISYT